MHAHVLSLPRNLLHKYSAPFRVGQWLPMAPIILSSPFKGNTLFPLPSKWLRLLLILERGGADGPMLLRLHLGKSSVSACCWLKEMHAHFDRVKALAGLIQLECITSHLQS